MTTLVHVREQLRSALTGTLPHDGPDRWQLMTDQPPYASCIGFIPPGTQHVPAGDAESAFYILRGRAVLAQPDGGEEQLAKGAAVYRAPGARCLLRTGTDTGALILAVSAGPGPRQRPAGGWACRVSAVPDDGTGTLASAGGFTQMGVSWLVTDATVGARAITLAVSAFAPGGSHTLHLHPAADEFFFVLSGKGEHLTSDGPLPVSPGTMVYVPAGEPHGFRGYPGASIHAVYGYFGAASLGGAGYQVLGEPAIERVAL